MESDMLRTRAHGQSELGFGDSVHAGRGALGVIRQEERGGPNGWGGRIEENKHQNNTGAERSEEKGKQDEKGTK